MNLSLYLLLTQPIDSRPSVRAIRSLQGKPKQHSSTVLAPVRTGINRRRAPLQARLRASRTVGPWASLVETSHSFSAARLGLAARVVGNAMGLLLMFGGLLLLLQIAQLSLS